MRRIALAAVTALLALAAPAGAEVRRLEYRVGPIEVAPYQVRQNGATLDIPKPDVDGAITAMDADLVDADGAKVPIRRLMLHHIVFGNIGPAFGDKQDATCDSILNLDNVTSIPGHVERFYAAGEERATLALPPGYGYPVRGDDRWSLTWMVMNHRATTDRAFIRYRITYDTDAAALTPVKPVWLDVRNCRSDPVYDVPGGGAPGSTDVQTTDWTSPEPARVIAAGGHVHGGGLALRLSEPDCGDRTLADVTPTWGRRSHPFYNVRPVLHEPGPVHMRGFASATGLPLDAGGRLRLSSVYDAERPHTRVMGIMIAFLAPAAPGQAGGCAPLPGDVAYEPRPDGRRTPPRVTVPLTGLDARGRARTIHGPPGAMRRAGRRATVQVKDFAFSRPNLSVARGATVAWRFRDPGLHDVTLASGPLGFSSPHQGRGGRFQQRLTRPGTYRLFCSLHPVLMTERIVVRR
jgi:plastocyanin